MELYEGEYVYEFVRSRGMTATDRFQHPLNKRFNERDDHDIDSIIRIQPPKTENLERLYNQERRQYEE